MELDFYHGVTAIQFFPFLRLPDLVYHCYVSSPLLSPVMFHLPYYSFPVILYPTFITGRYHLQLITGEPQAASRCCPANCQPPDPGPASGHHSLLGREMFVQWREPCTINPLGSKYLTMYGRLFGAFGKSEEGQSKVS